MPVINIMGVEYNLSTKLRVAYKLQEVNQRKPYMSIFEDIGEMPVEKHIQFLWISFNIENPNAMSLRDPSKIMTENEFRDYCLDEMGVEKILELIMDVINGIMYRGLDPEEVERKKAERSKKVGQTEE